MTLYRTAIAALLSFSVAPAAMAQSWTVPPGGSSETSPLSPTPSVLATGRALYDANCARCHARDAKGDGPDKTNDPAHRPPDLTNAFRAQFNPDGVIFYKIWNGREQPAMPAFKSKLSKDEVWAIVEYVKSLRR